MAFNSPYPKEFNPERAAVPTVATDITGATTDGILGSIEVQNSTVAALYLTVQDKQGTPRKLLDAVPIDPGVPFVISSFEQSGKFKTGLQWYASGVGLFGRAAGTVHPNFSS